MKTICSLQFDEAIEAIKGTEKVMYRHGVWNDYQERKPRMWSSPFGTAGTAPMSGMTRRRMCSMSASRPTAICGERRS